MLSINSMIKSHSLKRWFILLLVQASFVFPTAGFSQDRPARIVIDSVNLSTNDRVVISRYGVTREDLNSIENQVPGIEWSIPIRHTKPEVRYATQEAYVDLVGTSESYVKTLDPQRIRGRFLTERDIKHVNNVAVIGKKVSQRLFRDHEPIGRNIRIGADYYLVVGILDAGARRNEFESELVPIRTETIMNYDGTETTIEKVSLVEEPEESIYIPITTMKARQGDDAISRSSGSFEISSFQFSRVELVLEDPRHKLETARLIDQILKKNHPQVDYRIQLPR